LKHHFDIIIVGAGPAGLSAAIHLANSNFKIALIDKATFPRQKICGGGLSDRSVNCLKRMPYNIYSDFLKQPWARPCNGIVFGDTKGKLLNLKLPDTLTESWGFVVDRIKFDHFLFQKIEKFSNIKIFQNTNISSVEQATDCITVKSKTEEFSAKLLIVADGVNSFLARKLSGTKKVAGSYLISSRFIAENVADLSPQGHIELHFLKETLPFYFWIFPLENGLANIGTAYSLKFAKKTKKKVFNDVVSIFETHERFRERFKDAKIVSKVQTWALSLFSEPISYSGNRFLLTGDAAQIIDPATGEGIGNALLSGEYAAKMAITACSVQNFTHKFLFQYDQFLYKRIGKEMEQRKKLVGIFNSEFIINFLLKRLNSSNYVKSVYENYFNNKLPKWKFYSPLFYLKLLFAS